MAMAMAMAMAMGLENGIAKFAEAIEDERDEKMKLLEPLQRRAIDHSGRDAWCGRRLGVALTPLSIRPE